MTRLHIIIYALYNRISKTCSYNIIIVVAIRSARTRGVHIIMQRVIKNETHRDERRYRANSDKFTTM